MILHSEEQSDRQRIADTRYKRLDCRNLVEGDSRAGYLLFKSERRLLHRNI